MTTNMTDAIFEMIAGQEKVYSVYARLIKERILFVRGPIEQGMADTIAAQLLYLNHVSTSKTIQMFINSPGGEVTQGLVIFDMMKFIKAPVQTVGMGQCASMGAFLLAAGDTRMCLPSCRIMMHRVSGGAQGNIQDVKVTLKEMNYIDTYLTEKLSGFTKGKISVEKMEELTKRDYWMRPEEAIKHGFIDQLISNAKDKSKSK